MEMQIVDHAWNPLYIQLAPAVGVCVNGGWNRVWVNLERTADARWHDELRALDFQPVPAPSNGHCRHAFYLARAGSPFTAAGADSVRSILWNLCEIAFLITRPQVGGVANLS